MMNCKSIRKLDVNLRATILAMDVNFEEHSGLQTKRTLSGPMFGFRMSF